MSDVPKGLVSGAELLASRAAESLDKERWGDWQDILLKHNELRKELTSQGVPVPGKDVDDVLRGKLDSRGLGWGTPVEKAKLSELAHETGLLYQFLVDEGLAGTQNHLDPMEMVERLCERFHRVQSQLRKRHADRPTIEVNDEYDVQDLLHGLLRLHFDDVRPEEYTPSYAGAASRMDFLLKDEQIVIEVKKTRKGLQAKQVGEQLLVDIGRYQAHPDCKTLVCFVYDPEAWVQNPAGIEKDLTRTEEGLQVRVYIRPFA